MRQLLSKDLMYEPTKQVCDKFPEWLAIHKFFLYIIYFVTILTLSYEIKKIVKKNLISI
jgi:hypothetical protein